MKLEKKGHEPFNQHKPFKNTILCFLLLPLLLLAAPVIAETLTNTDETKEQHLAPSDKQKPFYIFLYPHEGLFWADSVSMATGMAQELGADLVALNFKDDPLKAIALLKELAPRMNQALGMVFDNVPGANERILAFCDQHQFPCININGSLSEIDFEPRSKYQYWVGQVLPDHQFAGEVLMEHLLKGAREKGWKEIHVLGIGGLTNSPGGNLRNLGWERRLKHQPDVKTTRLMSADWTSKTAAQTFRRALQENPELNVIWTASDDMALGVAEEAKRLAPEREFLIGGVDWSLEALQQILNGRMHYSVGGHLFEGALTIALLHDYNNGNDFLNEGLSFRTRMAPMDVDNIHDYMEFRKKPANLLGLYRLSKDKNHQLEYYPFDIQDLLKLLLSKPAKSPALELTRQEKAWLDTGHTIRARVNYVPPFMFSEPSPSGIAVDYLNSVAEQVGLNVKYVPDTIGWPESVQDLTQARRHYDLILTMKRTPKREQKIAFSTDFLFFPWVIIARDDADFIGDLPDLKSKTVAVERGYEMQNKLQSEYPTIILLETASSLAALEAVATRRADAYIGNLANASYLMRHHGLGNLKIAAPTSFENHDLAMAARKDWPELASIISKAIAAMPPEEHDTIRNRWLSVRYEHGLQLWKVVLWIGAVLLAAVTIIGLFLIWNRTLRREVKQRRTAENNLKKAKEVAESANQAKSSFLASMSHELRTPLNAILGFSEMMGRELEATQNQKEKLSIINRSGKHLLGMINDVLDLSKIEAGQAELAQEPFNLPKLLDDISRMFSARTDNAPLNFELEVAPDLAHYIKADAGKLRQVIINLLGNAVKFTSEGGVRLRVKTQTVATDPAWRPYRLRYMTVAWVSHLIS